MGLPLVTLQDYKLYKGIAGTSEDAQIQQIIPKVSELVKNICRRTFLDSASAPTQQIFDGGFKRLILAEAPLLELVSVEQSTDIGATYSLLTNRVDYVAETMGYIKCLHPRGYWLEMPQGYRVTYRAGYTFIPEDLKLAVLDLVTYYLKNHMALHTARAPGASTVQIEYTISNKLPTHIQRILDQYKYEVS